MLACFRTSTKTDQRDDDGREVFYRAMGPREFSKLVTSGGRLSLKSPTTELFVTQDLNYVATLSLRDDRFPIMVKFRVLQRTRSELLKRGAADGSIYDNVKALGYLPRVETHNPNQVHVKFVGYAITYGLRANTIDIFNNAVVTLKRIGYKGFQF